MGPKRLPPFKAPPARFRQPTQVAPVDPSQQRPKGPAAPQILPPRHVDYRLQARDAARGWANPQTGETGTSAREDLAAAAAAAQVQADRLSAAVQASNRMLDSHPVRTGRSGLSPRRRDLDARELELAEREAAVRELIDRGQANERRRCR